MANLTITNIEPNGVVLCKGEFNDDILTFAGAATVLAGTILARDSVSGNLVPFVVGGSTNENGIPKAVLTYDVTSDAAGDVAIRDMVSGTVRSPKLVIDADGDNSNINKVILDQLRDYSLVAVDVENLSVLDNQ